MSNFSNIPHMFFRTTEENDLFLGEDEKFPFLEGGKESLENYSREIRGRFWIYEQH